MNWIFIIIGAAFLAAYFSYNKDRRYRDADYKSIASEDVKKYLNLKTNDAEFEKKLPATPTGKKRLSEEILSELNKK